MLRTTTEEKVGEGTDSDLARDGDGLVLFNSLVGSHEGNGINDEGKSEAV